MPIENIPSNPNHLACIVDIHTKKSAILFSKRGFTEILPLVTNIFMKSKDCIFRQEENMCVGYLPFFSAIIYWQK
jgi:hypothetical protein